MSEKQVERLEVIQQLSNKQLSQREASRKLKLCTRQVRRLHKAYRSGGAKALVSKKRNKPSNNRVIQRKLQDSHSTHHDQPGSIRSNMRFLFDPFDRSCYSWVK